MSCYVLNSSFGSETVLDGYFSFIWTERFNKLGDFQIQVPNTAYFKNLLKEETLLRIDGSDEPMVVDVQQVQKQSDDSMRLIILGRDLTSWLERRVASFGYSQTATRASVIAVNVLNRAIFNGSDVDKLPNVTLSNSATDTVLFDYETTGGDMWGDVQDALDDNNIAMRMRLIGTTTKSLQLNIYNGIKRANVVFSDRNDTLINTKSIKSNRKLKNACAVMYKGSTATNAPTLTRIVYANGGSATLGGLSRRIMRLDMTSLNPADYPGTRLTTMIDKLGRAALAKQKRINGIDGEIPAYSQFQYRRDFYLGDLVTFTADDNVNSQARVTEYIWVEDEQGKRSYPTIEPTDDQTV